MKRVHKKNILRKSFEPGQKVLYNPHLHLFPSKFTISVDWSIHSSHCLSPGAIEIENPKNGDMLKVNGQYLKPFLEHEPPEVEEVLLDDPVY